VSRNASGKNKNVNLLISFDSLFNQILRLFLIGNVTDDWQDVRVAELLVAVISDLVQTLFSSGCNYYLTPPLRIPIGKFPTHARTGSSDHDDRFWLELILMEVLIRRWVVPHFDLFFYF
jgi:hypothetical protein